MRDATIDAIEDVTFAPPQLAAQPTGWSVFQRATGKVDEEVAGIDTDLAKLVMAIAEI